MNNVIFNPEGAEELSTGVLKMPLNGLYYLPRKVWEDERGFFTEIARIPELEPVRGTNFEVRQMNLSFSAQNVGRGFHAENWNKLMTVVDGVSFCSWADVRPDSPTFGQVVSMNLGRGEGAHFGSVFITKGIANSFVVIEGPSHYLYAVDQLYAERDTAGDVAISLFDEDLGVEWPIPKEEMQVSQRDIDAISLRDKFPEKF